MVLLLRLVHVCVTMILGTIVSSTLRCCFPLISSSLKISSFISSKFLEFIVINPCTSLVFFDSIGILSSSNSMNLSPVSFKVFGFMSDVVVCPLIFVVSSLFHLSNFPVYVYIFSIFSLLQLHGASRFDLKYNGLP